MIFHQRLLFAQWWHTHWNNYIYYYSEAISALLSICHMTEKVSRRKTIDLIKDFFCLPSMKAPKIFVEQSQNFWIS